MSIPDYFIEYKLSLKLLNIAFPKYYITPSNIGKSYFKQLYLMTFPLQSDKINIYSVYFENITIIGDYSEMFYSNIETITLISLDSYQLMAQLDKIYANSLIILFQKPLVNIVVKLNYYKFTNVLSNLGDPFLYSF